jgi:alpha-galactosidase
VSKSHTITAHRFSNPIELDARNPSPEWRLADPIRFASDWQGKNPDPAFETEVRALWSPETFYLLFVCRYQELFVFEDSDPNGRRGQLWDRDVAEAFLQPPDSVIKSSRHSTSTSRYRAFYKEFEVAPNGMWLDLDISPSGAADLRSGLARSVHVDEEKKVWSAELAIPMRSLSANFDPTQEWRANFFRVEGKAEPRRYMAWQATNTPQPDFHVAEAFGIIVFEP